MYGHLVTYFKTVLLHQQEQGLDQQYVSLEETVSTVILTNTTLHTTLQCVMCEVSCLCTNSFLSLHVFYLPFSFYHTCLSSTKSCIHSLTVSKILSTTQFSNVSWSAVRTDTDTMNDAHCRAFSCVRFHVADSDHRYCRSFFQSLSMMWTRWENECLATVHRNGMKPRCLNWWTATEILLINMQLKDTKHPDLRKLSDFVFVPCKTYCLFYAILQG